jgi:hypothetical protein
MHTVGDAQPLSLTLPCTPRSASRPGAGEKPIYGKATNKRILVLCDPLARLAALLPDHYATSGQLLAG